MTRPAGGTITIAPAPDGAWIIFSGMERAPAPAVRWVPSMDAARSFAIAMHQAHGWPIEEAIEGTEGDR